MDHRGQWILNDQNNLYYQILGKRKQGCTKGILSANSKAFPTNGR